MTQSTKQTTLEGVIVSAYGKRFDVETSKPSTQELAADTAQAVLRKNRISCVTRGKKTDVACGDTVTIQLTDNHEGVIETIHPRKTLLYRSNAFKSKMLAANVSQIVIVLATQPSFYEALLNRCLIAAEAAQIKALIVLNKCDLADSVGAREKLSLYKSLGYDVIGISAITDIAGLMQHLEGHASILVGQSGMGKSTMINALLPNAAVRTQEVSQVLDSGKHTTTAAHLYHLNTTSQLIDSPGLQEFGLHHLSIEALEHAFIEFRPFLGHCRFNNCQHTHEPDCAIMHGEKSGAISAIRLNTYQLLRDEINASHAILNPGA